MAAHPSLLSSFVCFGCFSNRHQTFLQALLGGKDDTKPIASIIRRVQEQEQEKLTVVRARETLASHRESVL